MMNVRHWLQNRSREMCLAEISACMESRFYVTRDVHGPLFGFITIAPLSTLVTCIFSLCQARFLFLPFFLCLLKAVFTRYHCK
jgi:hypothetical protein